MKFIHAADLHIDSPLRGLDRYDGAPVDRLRGATRKAFAQLIDLAVDEAVDFVLLAGDIYDGDWPDFHTGLYFREQMVRLGRADIPVFIVHGNHDARSVISGKLVLPANVTVFSSRSSGSVTLDGFSVAVHGRSFPNRAVDEDLVPDYPDPVPGYFNIGLLHTSLAGGSGHDTYAPTDVATLASKGYDYWALGHIHMREVVCQNPRIIFPGNLQGRHAKETGEKGCELVTVEAGSITTEFIPLDVVRWNQITLRLDGIDKLELVGAAFRQALDPLLVGACDRLHAVRVLLVGSTHLHGLEANKPGTLDAAIRGAAQDVDEAEIWVEQVRVALTTPLDRDMAAQREDAIGELIRLVDAIGADEEGLTTMIQSELATLLDILPAEVTSADDFELHEHDTLLALLRDAEATVLARLSDSDVNA
ncbi:MAG: DNA repair exonuclease [Mariprofundus sp.]